MNVYNIRFSMQTVPYTTMHVVLLLLGIVSLVCIPETAHALQSGAASGQLDAAGSATGLTGGDPRLFIANLIQAALGVLGTIFAGLIVLAGYWFLVARGREDYIEKAKKTMLRAVIGLILILGAYSITTLVKQSVEELGNAARDSAGGRQGGVDVTGSVCCMVCDRTDGSATCNFDTFNSANRSYVKGIYQLPVTPDRCSALRVIRACETAENCVINEVTSPQCNIAEPVPKDVYEE